MLIMFKYLSTKKILCNNYTTAKLTDKASIYYNNQPLIVRNWLDEEAFAIMKVLLMFNECKNI